MLHQPGKPYLIILLLLIISQTKGCINDAPSLPDSREEALLMIAGTESKSWQLSSMRLNGTNVTILLKSCDKDNVYTFFRNGEGPRFQVINENADPINRIFWPPAIGISV